MEWNSEQEACLKDMSRFVQDTSRPFYHLRGRAGTGKTTLASEIRDKFSSLRWIALAYTGKAASVLRRKGWDNASTIHSKLYLPGMASRARLNAWLKDLEVIKLALVDECALKEHSKESLMKQAKDLQDKIADEEEAQKSPSFIYNQESELMDFDVIVVDEVSMIGEQNGADLVRMANEAGLKLILMGDDNQLPPVKSRAYFMDDVKPDFVLNRIERQRKDDPILHLADLCIEKRRLSLGSYGESRVVRRLDPEECLECDQLLVGKNDTRIYYTNRLRELRGYTDEVEVGEKLMCLANSKEGYFNGSMWYVQDVFNKSPNGERIMVRLASDDELEHERNVWLHTKALRHEKVEWMDAQGAQVMVSAEAATVHKFQGSEGKHIVLYDESGTARHDWWRWMYTGTTRAQKKITIVQPD